MCGPSFSAFLGNTVYSFAVLALQIHSSLLLQKTRLHTALCKGKQRNLQHRSSAADVRVTRILNVQHCAKGSSEQTKRLPLISWPPLRWFIIQQRAKLDSTASFDDKTLYYDTYMNVFCSKIFFWIVIFNSTKADNSTVLHLFSPYLNFGIA